MSLLDNFNDNFLTCDTFDALMESDLNVELDDEVSYEADEVIDISDDDGDEVVVKDDGEIDPDEEYVAATMAEEFSLALEEAFAEVDIEEDDDGDEVEVEDVEDDVDAFEAAMTVVKECAMEGVEVIADPDQEELAEEIINAIDEERGDVLSDDEEFLDNTDFDEALESAMEAINEIDALMSENEEVEEENISLDSLINEFMK